MVGTVDLLTLLLLLLLNIVGICNGGVTSRYVRKAEPSVDMPLAAFPPPPGFNAPEQVLLLYRIIKLLSSGFLV